MLTVAENIRSIIVKQGLKQNVVAERACFTEAEFSQMLCGRKLIRVEYIPDIARALGVEPNLLFLDVGKAEIDTK